MQLEIAPSFSKVCGVLLAYSPAVSYNGNLFLCYTLGSLFTFPDVAVHIDMLAVVADWLHTDLSSMYGTQGPEQLGPFGQTPWLKGLCPYFIGARQMIVFNMYPAGKTVEKYFFNIPSQTKIRFQNLRKAKFSFSIKSRGKA